MNGKALQEGRYMICFCINNNHGSRNHIFSTITLSIFLVHLFFTSFVHLILVGKSLHSFKPSDLLHVLEVSLLLCRFHLLGSSIGNINLFLDDQG